LGKPTVEKPKRKKVSFDDILSNMNLVVNKNGALQKMIPTQNMFTRESQEPIQADYIRVQQQPDYTRQQPDYTRQQQQPLDPSVKHSYIFNKYFKDYKDANTSLEPEVKVPKTIQEYRQMLLEERIKKIEQQKRISQIKSTKLMFTTNTGNNGNIQASKNTLRSMSFR
jgi:hypothetical protein